MKDLTQAPPFVGRVPIGLYPRWVLTALGFGVLLGGISLSFSPLWSASIRLAWLLAAYLFSFYVLVVLWKALPLNYRLRDGAIFPYFGAGNSLSLVRSGFLAALAGFLVTPPPSGWMAWLPATLYLLNGFADLFDGYLARRADQVTRLGERLDMSLDGWGVLFASCLLYRYGTLPAWILLVGAARFLFLAVAKLREKLGKPLYDLPPSSLRRALAGAQMGYLGAVLLPLFTPPATAWAGAFFSFPFLFHFGWDLLRMCGIPGEDKQRKWLSQRLLRGVNRVRRALLGWLPLGLRLLVGMVMLAQFAGWLTEPPPFLAVRTPLGSSQTHFHLMLTFYALGGLSTVLGVIGRGGAALLLLGVGLQQGILPLGWQGRMILIAACGLFFLGSGLAAIWQPEEQLIRRRWGERRDVSAS